MPHPSSITILRLSLPKTLSAPVADQRLTRKTKKVSPPRRKKFWGIRNHTRIRVSRLPKLPGAIGEYPE